VAVEQKQVLIKIGADFLAEIDAAFPKLGFGDRASFIRDAMFEELRRNGFSVPAEIKAPPSRAGKGGTPSHKSQKVVKSKSVKVPLNRDSKPEMAAEDGRFNGKVISPKNND